MAMENSENSVREDLSYAHDFFSYLVFFALDTILRSRLCITMCTIS